MDQVKIYLDMAIKYRFWITIGLAMILSLVAYIIGSGPVLAEAEQNTSTITQAKEGVQGVANNRQPIIGKHAELAKSEIAVVTRDVNEAWDDLYEHQAGLLTWPYEETMNAPLSFPTWGRTWPEGVDEAEVQLEINTYTEVFDRYVDRIYKIFNPWDPVEGTGVVVAPARDDLLLPPTFSRTSPPKLNDIWKTQEKLWIQAALLEVVATVNAPAETWQDAKIKQILSLEVASPMAMDQISLAKGDQLAPPPEITRPGSESTLASTSGGGQSAASSGGYASASQQEESEYGSSYFGGGGGGGMLGRAGGRRGGSSAVLYVQEDSPHYKTVPVSMVVLMEQEYVNTYLIALENSPMAIQVNEVQIQRPKIKVSEPKKGESLPGGGRRSGGMGGYFQGEEGYGADYGSEMFGGSGYMQGEQGYGAGYGMDGGYGGMFGEAGFGGGRGRFNNAQRGAGQMGRDVRSRNIMDERRRSDDEEDDEKAGAKNKASELFDPYYNVVEVSFYGRARFYNRPPEGESPESTESLGGDPTATMTDLQGDSAGDQAPAPTEAETPADQADPTDTGDEAARDEEDNDNADESAEPSIDDPVGADSNTGGLPEQS